MYLWLAAGQQVSASRAWPLVNQGSGNDRATRVSSSSRLPGCVPVQAAGVQDTGRFQDIWRPDLPTMSTGQNQALGQPRSKA